MCTYFGYLILAAVMEFQSLKPERRPDVIEYIFIFTPSLLGIVILDGYAAIKSESGILLLIGHVIYVITAFVMILLKKIKCTRYPIFLSMLVGSILVMIYHLNFIIAHGIYPWYPFYSEVFDHF